jgi:hypothetical protein
MKDFEGVKKEEMDALMMCLDMIKVQIPSMYD